MNRPTKSQIKASVDALKKPAENSAGEVVPSTTPHLEDKKSNKNRIRKKGV